MTLPAHRPPPIAPGDVIAGKYEVVRVVGEGGMGVVYEVVHTRLQQRAAIKMLQPHVLTLPDVVARFEREARAACRLRSRYAVRIQDVDHDAVGRAYMVMEYLEGHDLSHELDTRGRLPIGEAVDIVLMACAAMAEAHAGGVVHRDLKPSNLFLVREGSKRIVKLLDFGISKITSETEAAVTSTFATMGTPLYMSPEQIRSAKNVDARTDVWSLGIILFETLAGVRPFQGPTTAAAAAIVADPPPPLRQLAPAVPEALERAVVTALAKRPEERFPDVRAFAEAIAPFAASDLLGEVAEAAVPRQPTSALPPVRPSSSFVHATTLAQPTPPASKPLSPLAASVGARPVASDAASGSDATQGAWSDREGTKAARGPRAWAVVGVGVLALGGAGVAFFRGHAPASPPPPVGPSAAGSVAETPPSPLPVPASASAASPPVAPTSPPAPSAAPAPSPGPAASSHRPRHPPAPPPQHSAAPSATGAPPPPATTNPVHL